MNSFKMRLRNGEALIGSLVTLSSPDVAEIMSMVGFDYLWIDMEHAPLDFAHVQAMIQAVGGRCPCLVRVPENREVWIKKALDTGCDGIIVPQVKSAAAAREAIAACLYPPAGERSVGIARVHGYGMTFQDYVHKANEDLMIVLQVEHIEGVRNIESIVNVPGIDVVFIGPFDLSGSLGVLGQVDHPQVQEAIEEVQRHCTEARIPTGIFVVDAESARISIEEGFNLIALSVDFFYLWKSAKVALDQVRDES